VGTQKWVTTQGKEESSWLARRREIVMRGGRRRLGDKIDLGFPPFFFLLSKLPPSPL